MTIDAWQAKEHTFRLRVSCTYNEFRCLLDEWSAETMRLYRSVGEFSDEASNSFPIISPFNFFDVRINNTTK
jgi:hypothetical protein